MPSAAMSLARVNVTTAIAPTAAAANNLRATRLQLARSAVARPRRFGFSSSPVRRLQVAGRSEGRISKKDLAHRHPYWTHIDIEELQEDDYTYVRSGMHGRKEMIYMVELPAIDMGLTFQETGEGFAIVEAVDPEGAASAVGILAGDVLVRCTATVLDDGKTIVPLGDTPPPPTSWHKIMFTCRGEDFDTIMAAVKSTGIVDAGSRHHLVALEFRRDISEGLAVEEGGEVLPRDQIGEPTTQYPSIDKVEQKKKDYVE